MVENEVSLSSEGAIIGDEGTSGNYYQSDLLSTRNQSNEAHSKACIVGVYQLLRRY